MISFKKSFPIQTSDLPSARKSVLAKKAAMHVPNAMPMPVPYATKQNETNVYRCHVGLTEAIMPLHVGKVLVGYLLFGHVFTYGSLEKGWKIIEKCYHCYPVDSQKLKSSLEDMPQTSHEYIRSAARLLHLTASYPFTAKYTLDHPEVLEGNHDTEPRQVVPQQQKHHSRN